jgi:retron-type reverse transcriptase
MADSGHWASPRWKTRSSSRRLLWVIQSVYEQDFLGFSYGFRPNRSCHQALDALTVAICDKQVRWILDADIQGFL